MRLLDRLFGALPYPLDILLPSAAWLVLCILAGAFLVLWARRRGYARVTAAVVAGLALAAMDMLLWSGFVAARIFAGDAPLTWQPALEAPFTVLRELCGSVLWQVFGVVSAVEPAQLFRGYSSWNGHWSALLAGLLNEAAALALAVLAVVIAAAAWRSARMPAARKGG